VRRAVLPSRVNQPIFGDDWVKTARAKSGSDSWANEVVDTLDTTGQIYLSTLRLWFDHYPLTPKQKRDLFARLENLQDDQHLGGVNELTWWAFMQHDGIKGDPLPVSTTPRPDFQLQPPADCFVEVSTLNISDSDKKAFEAKNSVALNHAETVRRVFGKLTNAPEKCEQLKYAAKKGKPSVLVVFDYTTWSGLGTQFFRTLGDTLLGAQFAFMKLPPELSAIVYLERKVLHGQIVLSRARSAIYYNPLALHPLRQGAFPSLAEFSCQVVSVESKSVEPWLWL
jgi:hypothetical protein